MLYTYKYMEYLGQYVRGIPHPAWVGAAIQGAASLINMAFQSSANRQMLENASELLSREQSFQRGMNRDMYSTYRHSLEGAGMNLNSELGGYPNTSSPSANTPGLSAPQLDLSSAASLLQQQPLVDANVRKTQADAKAQEIENERNSSEDSMLYNLDIISQQKEKDKDNKSAPEDIPELKVAPFNAGSLRALRSYNMYKGEASDVDKNIAQNALSVLVANEQIKDSDVIQDFVRLPVAEFNKIWNESLYFAQQTLTSKAQENLFDSQKAMIDFEKKMAENSNIHNLIDKYLGKGAVSDVCHAIVMLLQACSGRISFSHKF